MPIRYKICILYIDTEIFHKILYKKREIVEIDLKADNIFKIHLLPSISLTFFYFLLFPFSFAISSH